ncbi:MAG: alpha/beta hydrolase [Cyanobacteria bacterium P01_H01_bin.15]
MVTQLTAPTSAPPSRIGGSAAIFSWQFQDQAMDIAWERRGQGEHRVLLLPALSTVSTRSELRALATLLIPQFEVIALDWPGFGDSRRLPISYEPALHQQFLRDFIAEAMPTGPFSAIACGHAGGYLLKALQNQPALLTKLVLAAPTWKGPMTAMGAPPWLKDWIRNLISTEGLGDWVFEVNTSTDALRSQYLGHVYTQDELLTSEFLSQRQYFTQQSHARFATAAFVSGKLDPVESRGELVNLVTAQSAPILVVMGEQVPKISKTEMQAVAELPGVESIILPGALGLYEESAIPLGKAAIAFFNRAS